eukprot:COSAG05_NODE_297_length_11939_cov_17.362753_7_plen_261_part_00
MTKKWQQIKKLADRADGACKWVLRNCKRTRPGTRSAAETKELVDTQFPPKGRTMLMVAALKGRTRCVGELLRRWGADANQQTKQKQETVTQPPFCAAGFGVLGAASPIICLCLRHCVVSVWAGVAPGRVRRARRVCEAAAGARGEHGRDERVPGDGAADGGRSQEAGVRGHTETRAVVTPGSENQSIPGARENKITTIVFTLDCAASVILCIILASRPARKALHRLAAPEKHFLCSAPAADPAGGGKGEGVAGVDVRPAA